MLRKIDLAMSESERSRYKIVRRDLMTDVPGLILSANVETGICMMKIPGDKTQEHNFGPEGLMIVAAGR